MSVMNEMNERTTRYHLFSEPGGGGEHPEAGHEERVVHRQAQVDDQ